LGSPVPAICGGPPVFEQKFRFIAPTLPPLKEVVAQYERSYEERLVTNGDCVARFEAAVAERLNVRHCVAVSSCTSGLTLLMRALDLSGEVIIPSFTFFATGHAARWNGLTPVFADIDPDTWTISLADVERKITRATSAIVGVHLYGNPCDVDGLQELAERRGLKLIFDAAHAFGSATQTRAIGQFGDAEVFSLSPTKLLVAGEGGLITTNNPDLAKDLRALRNYGDAGNYDPAKLGANARMSEFNAALGLSGLPLVDEKVNRRQHIAARYTDHLTQVGGCNFQQVRDGDCHTYKDYSVKLDPAAFGMGIDELRKALLEENIETRRYFYPPLHLQSLYSQFFRNGIDKLPVAEEVASNILSLPIYEALPDRTVDLVASAIRRVHLHQKRVGISTAPGVGHVSKSVA
jgi:dTDP-4-amino-4,6-dideoxygalactose transaminase